MISLAIIATFVCACGAEDDLAPEGKLAEPPLYGKSDLAKTFNVVESGRFVEASATVSGRIEGSEALSYRFNGFGDTTVRIELTSPGLEVDTYVIIDGPFPGGSGTIAAYNDDREDQDTLDSFIEVTLPEPGAYRILVGSYSVFHQQAEPGGAFDLKYECLENCTMKQISLGELLAALNEELGADGTQQTLVSAIDALFPDEKSAALVKGQLAAALMDPNVEGFPFLPLDLGNEAQGLFEADETVVDAPTAVHFSVDQILNEGCTAKRSEMKPVDERVPGLMSGSWADYTIDDCSLQRAQAFAEVLNNLSLENGSTVTYEDRTYNSVMDVITALTESGHHIKVTNDRFFADFLGLYYKGAAVAAPMWLQTTIPLAGGEGTLSIPSPHTHHTFVVSGPLVNATLMFYMGVSGGTSFRAVSNIRSPWTGLRTLHTYDSDAEPEQIREIFWAAGLLRKLWTEQAAGLPAGGYGTLGVCNDSTAVLESVAEYGAPATIFPLAHPVLDEVPADDPGGVSAALKALPSDVDGYDSTDALNRILKTLPAENLDDIEFPQFIGHIRALAQ